MSSAIHHPSTADLDLATVLRALGDPARLAIVRLLIDQGERNCASLQTQLEMPNSTCSYHLKLLREAGVTRTRSSGTLRYVSVRADDLEHRFPGLVRALEVATASTDATPKLVPATS